MEAEAYFDSLLNEASSIILSPPILYQLKAFTTHQLGLFFLQIYNFVNLFPGFFGALLWQTNNEAIRFALIENLVDECGGFENIRSRNYSETHSELLKQFILKLGLSPSDINEQSVDINTKILLNNFNKIFINSTLIEALGAMTCMENISTNWFNLVLLQLKERNEFTDDDLYFFSLHTVADVAHGNILKETLIPLLLNKENCALLKNGVMMTASIWKNFYYSISKVLLVQK